MPYGGEILTEVTAYTLCRGVDVVHVGVLLFESFQFVHHLVKFLIGNGGRVQHVVVVIVCVQLFPEL